MNYSQLIRLHSIEDDLKSAINSSIFELTNSNKSINLWADTKLKKEVKRSMENWCQNFATNSHIHSSSCHLPPPGSGLNVIFGLQVQLNYRIRFKANMNVGYGMRVDNFATTSSLHLSAYNGGLGANKKNIVVDVTAAANIIVGDSHGTPLQTYTLNYDSPTPMLNDFKNSISYGQLFTWNSHLHSNTFSLDDIQRQGMIGFRLGNVAVSSNNDTRYYLGGGTDKGWTGGISIVTPIIEVGFQDFTGTHDNSAFPERQKEKLENEIKTIRKSNLTKDEKKKRMLIIKENLARLTNNFLHTQNKQQKQLNKASTYFRVNYEGFQTTIDVIGDAWLQNFIHKSIADFKFEYNHKSIDIWTGKKW